jgi:hypothetical protein
MDRTLDDDFVSANARVWDFVVPPKSCSTFPLSSENLCIRGCIRLPGPVAALCERRYLSSIRRRS